MTELKMMMSLSGHIIDSKLAQTTPFDNLQMDALLDAFGDYVQSLTDCVNDYGDGVDGAYVLSVLKLYNLGVTHAVGALGKSGLSRSVSHLSDPIIDRLSVACRP